MATVTLNTLFDTANGVFKFNDTSDYAGQGISTADVNGNIAIKLNGNIIYNNPNAIPTDITGTAQGGSTSQITLQAGSSSTDNYFKGRYLLATGGTGAGQAAKVASYNGTTKVAVFESPVGVAFDSTTTYKFILNDIFIEANTNSQGTIPLPLNINGQVVAGTYEFIYTVYDTNAAQYYGTSYTYTYGATLPVGELEFTVNCNSPYVKLRDLTSYNIGGIVPTYTRTLTLNYPPNVDPLPSPIVSANAVITTSEVYSNATYGGTLSTVATWQLSQYVSVSGTITASASADVTCDNSLCNLYCCYKYLYNEWVSAKCSNKALAAKYWEQLIEATSLIQQIQYAISCGRDGDVASLTAQFYAVTNCTNGCQCDSPTPQLVIGSDTSIIYDLIAADSSIIIVPNTVGTTTTWSIQLNPTLQQAIYSSDEVQGIVNIRTVTTGLPPSTTTTVQGADVLAGKGVGVTTTGSPITSYTVALKNLLKDQLAVVPTTTTGSFEELMAYNMPSGTLFNDGDSLDIVAWFDCTPNSNVKKCKVAINNTPIFADIFLSSPQHRLAIFDIKVVKKSATQIGYTFKVTVGNETFPSVYSFVAYDTASSISINNLSSTSNKISLDAQSAIAGDVSAVFLQIKLNKV